MGDRSENLRSGSRGRLRPWIIVSALLLAVVIVGLVVDRAKEVDAAEFDVLDQLLADGFPVSTYDVHGVQRSDGSPCWWWCEDDQLDVDLRADIASDAVATPAEQCERLASSITALVGEQPDEQEGYRGRACFLIWWDFEYKGRRLRLDVDVSDRTDSAFAIRVENLSASRAFLPYG